MFPALTKKWTQTINQVLVNHVLINCLDIFLDQGPGDPIWNTYT